MVCEVVVGVVGEELEQAVAGLARPGGHDGHQHAQRDEREQDEHGLPLGARREQKRHGEDRAELAPGAVRQDGFAHPRLHELALLQDRHERPERRGGQHDGHGDAFEMVVRERREQADDQQRGGEGHDPRAEAPLALGTRQVLGVDLVARQEEQEGKAQVGQQVHRVREVDDLGQVRSREAAPATSRNTVSGTSLLGTSRAARGQTAATRAIMVEQTRLTVMEGPFGASARRCW